MSNYVDGFVHPVPRNKLEAYKRLVAEVAQIWRKHGALDYWECVGDDMHLDGTRPLRSSLPQQKTTPSCSAGLLLNRVKHEIWPT